MKIILKYWPIFYLTFYNSYKLIQHQMKWGNAGSQIYSACTPVLCKNSTAKGDVKRRAKGTDVAENVNEFCNSL